MPYPPSLKEIQDIGLRNGLDSIGIAKAEIFESTLKDLQHRKSQNLHAGMSFTYRNPERSTNPKKTMPEGQSLIVGAKSYWQPLSESAKNIDLEQVLITSTSETYGTAQYVPIDEKHPLVGQSPYSASKIAADQLAISYFRSFDLPVKIVRPFNTYGPRQSARAIIPTIISQLLNGNKSIELGNISPTRDLTYVTDTCEGVYEIYNSDSIFGEVINVGMNSEISIGDLVGLISSIMNVDITIQCSENRIRPEKSEVERLICSNQKLISHSSWNPKYDIKSGLSETIQWFQEKGKLIKSNLYNV